MGLFDNFPYTNFHELNLDWILKVLKDIENTIDEFVSLNIIKYADPIQWDIVRQYPKNTIVIDPVSGTAYISVDNVPQGVPLSNTDYWSVVFDLGRFVTLASQNFALSYEPLLTTTATMPTIEGGWVVWNSILYEALNDIHVGDRYVENGNIKKTPVEEFFNRLKATVTQEILDRQSADNTLNGRIDQEILDRQAVDNSLGGRIDQEILDRQSADNALGSRIDQEILNRQSADNALGGRIDQEILNRQSADTALYRYIDDSMANIKSLGNTVVLGNSYASGTGSPEGHGLFYFLQPLMKNGYLFSGSGTSFVDYDGNHQNDRFINHLNAAISSEAFNNADIDTILILGAYGESRAYISAGRSLIDARTLLSPAIEQFATRARNAFPNLKNIIYANCESRAKNMINSGGYMSFLNDSYMVDYVCYPLLIENRIMNLGWSGIDAIYYSNLFSSDFYHPNTSGYKMIASSIINSFSGGRNDRHYRMDYSYDVSNLTGVSGSTLHGRHIMDAFRKDFNAQYITIPAGSYSLNTNYISINLNEQVIPPFNEPYGDTYMSPSSVQGQYFNWIFRFSLVGAGLALEIRADRAISGTSSSDLAVPFNFGIC